MPQRRMTRCLLRIGKGMATVVWWACMDSLLMESLVIRSIATGRGPIPMAISSSSAWCKANVTLSITITSRTPMGWATLPLTKQATILKSWCQALLTPSTNSTKWQPPLTACNSISIWPLCKLSITSSKRNSKSMVLQGVTWVPTKARQATSKRCMRCLTSRSSHRLRLMRARRSLGLLSTSTCRPWLATLMLPKSLVWSSTSTPLSSICPSRTTRTCRTRSSQPCSFWWATIWSLWEVLRRRVTSLLRAIMPRVKLWVSLELKLSSFEAILQFDPLWEINKVTTRD